MSPEGAVGTADRRSTSEQEAKRSENKDGRVRSGRVESGPVGSHEVAQCVQWVGEGIVEHVLLARRDVVAGCDVAPFADRLEDVGDHGPGAALRQSEVPGHLQSGLGFVVRAG